MNKVLIAVDSSKGSRACIKTFIRLFSGAPAKTVILANVQQFGGSTMIHDRISDAEMLTLEEELEKSGAKKEMDRKSNAILKSHKKTLERSGIKRIKTVIREGHVAEEILKTIEKEKADLIIIGATRTLAQKLIMGDVTGEVAKKAKIPVMLVR
ncbi:MAG: universal stress protein [Nitrospirae bacterium]|nr:universal stress protein [Nitrospirota bacterium]